MILEDECAKLEKWFETTYPDGRIKIFQGMNSKSRAEEYRIHFQFAGHHFGAELDVPPGAELQEKGFIQMFRNQFLASQKQKIAKAISGIVQ